MSILPPLPTPPNSTELKMAVLLPASSTAPDARTDTLPAFPCPNEVASSLPPSFKDKEPVVILMLPLLPVARDPTLLNT
ncbi:hypothetical protein SAMD00079811_00050 [Scytonema sp. HK-05]|nr:hypothetical protein SAMD00079811_00050 [Scytonema sp. HK-05]